MREIEMERAMPASQSLEWLLTQHGKSIKSEFDCVRARQGGDVVDHTVRMRAGINYPLVTGREFADVYLGIDYDSDPNALESIERSVAFAVQAVAEIGHEPQELAFMEYLADMIVSEHGASTTLRLDVYDYLVERPHLKELIEYYGSNVAGSYLYREAAIITCGMIWKLTERKLAQAFIEREMETLNPSDFGRPGDLPETP